MTLQGSSFNVYYNGGLLANFPADIGTRPLGLGNYFLFNSGGYQYPYNGLVQEVGIWSTALSSQQVSQLYSLQSVPEPSTYALLGIGAIGLLMRRKLIA